MVSNIALCATLLIMIIEIAILRKRIFKLQSALERQEKDLETALQHQGCIMYKELLDNIHKWLEGREKILKEL